MTSFFQKNYIKIPVIAVIIFTFLFQSFPPPQKVKSVKAASKIDYLDICEPKVPFYNEALQTDKLREACYLLKKIQDKAAQAVDVAREMHQATDPLTECNPLWGEKFPYITGGNCKSACAWSLPELTISIDLTTALVCAVSCATAGCAACSGDIKAIKDALDIIKKIYDLYKILKKFKAAIDVINDLIDTYKTTQELAEKIEELSRTLSNIDLSKLNQFYDTLTDLMRTQLEIQNEITKIEGKIQRMKNTISEFSQGQLQGIYRIVSEIGKIYATYILKPGQPPEPVDNEERPFVDSPIPEKQNKIYHL